MTYILHENLVLHNLYRITQQTSRSNRIYKNIRITNLFPRTLNTVLPAALFAQLSPIIAKQETRAHIFLQLHQITRQLLLLNTSLASPRHSHSRAHFFAITFLLLSLSTTSSRDFATAPRAHTLTIPLRVRTHT